MVLVAWFKELQSRDPALSRVLLGVLDRVKKWLLDLLACSDPAFPTKDSILPYCELSRTYSKMRSEASSLFHIVESCGIFKEYLSSFNSNLDMIGIDEAINFASRLPSPAESHAASNIEKRLLDELESAKQRLLSTAGYLKCVQVAYAILFTSFCS